MKPIFSLYIPGETDYPEMLCLWESSVRATHDFLSETDIDKLKHLIIDHNIFASIDVTCARDISNRIVGMMGVSGDNLSMLFIAAGFTGKGIGKMLVEHAIERFGISKVDVNEQNADAVGFYRHMGFRMISRSELDDYGNAFPLLHMSL